MFHHFDKIRDVTDRRMDGETDEWTDRHLATA